LGFSDQTIRITPGAVEPKNGYVYPGTGLKGGIENTVALVLMQSRDIFGNKVETKAGGDSYVVRIASSKGIVYHVSGYTYPGGIRDNTTDSFPNETMTAEEEVLKSDGFWRVRYTVPAVGSAKYNVTVIYANATKLMNLQNGLGFAVVDYAPLFSDPNAIVITNAQAQASPATGGTVGAFNDNATVIGASVGAGAVVLALGGYGMWRLQRYRPKYLEQRARAEEAEEELRNMAVEIDVIPGGQDYESVGAAIVSVNPLHQAYQLKKAQNQEEMGQIDEPKDIVEDRGSRKAFRKELGVGLQQPLVGQMDD